MSREITVVQFVWPMGYKGNIGLTDMEIESKWLESEDRGLTTQSLSSPVTRSLQVKSISDLLFWDRFVNVDRWVRLSVEKSFERQMLLKWDETRKTIRLSPLYPALSLCPLIGTKMKNKNIVICSKGNIFCGLFKTQGISTKVHVFCRYDTSYKRYILNDQRDQLL